MSTKIGFGSLVVLAVLGGNLARAQDFVSPTAAELHNVPAYAPENQPAPPPPPGSEGLSGWMTYTKPDCCEPTGKHGPLCYELYLRNGASVPVGGLLHELLETGWEIQGGGRVLFFDPDEEAAWTLDVNLGNIANHANNSPQRLAMNVLVPRPVDQNNPNNPNPTINGVALPPQFQVNQLNPNQGYPQSAAIPVPFGTTAAQNGFGADFPGLTLTSLNRTFVDIAGGREWYLLAPAKGCCGPMWRAGFDVGFRWGTTKANFKEIRHRTDTFTGAVAALHTDLEWSCGGCCVFELGFRAEWDYIFMNHLLQQNDSDLQSVSFLATTGIRF